MSHGLLLKKKEQHLQHQLMLQQQQQMSQLQQHHHSFPSPITPTYDKKVFSSPSSSCRFDGVSSNGSSASNQHPTEVSSNTSLYSSPSSSSASTPSSTSSNRHSYGQFPFNDVYGSSGSFLSSSYAAAAALGTSHHDLTRSCSALPSPTIYPPTPPPSTPWIHPAWFGSMESTGYMKTPKTNPFDN